MIRHIRLRDLYISSVTRLCKKINYIGTYTHRVQNGRVRMVIISSNRYFTFSIFVITDTQYEFTLI